MKRLLPLLLILLTMPCLAQHTTPYKNEMQQPACKAHPEFCLPLLTTVPSEVKRQIEEADASVKEAQKTVAELIKARNLLLDKLIADRGLDKYPATVLSYTYDAGGTFLSMQWGGGTDSYMHKNCLGTITMRDGFLFYIPATDVSWCTVEEIMSDPNTKRNTIIFP